MSNTRAQTDWSHPLGKCLLGLAVSVFFLLLLEGGTRLLPLSRLERGQPGVAYPLYVRGSGKDAGYFLTNPHYARVMSPQRLAAEKAAGTKRIFVLGGSAANGWPWPIELAFTGYLQRALDRGAPGRYEIINAAAMGFGSVRVLDLLADVVRMEPDLIIVWSGSNEYIDLGARPQLVRNEGMVSLRRMLRRSSLYRSIRLLLLTVVPDLFVAQERADLTHLRENLPTERTVAGRTPELDTEINENFGFNLQQMAGLIEDSGAIGAFCTVPVNLSGWAPQNVSPANPLEWRQLKDAAFRLYDEGKYTAAAQTLEELLRGSPRYTLAHYLLGQSYHRLGLMDKARQSYRTACDLDPRPLRASSSIQQRIRVVATSEKMRLVDLEQVFARYSGRELVGLDLFLDHVHLNDAGNRLAAVSVIPVIAEAFDASLDQRRVEDFIWQEPLPTVQSLNVIDIAYVQGMTYLNNGALGKAEEAFLLVLELAPDFADPAGALGEIYERRGDSARAFKYYRQALNADPASPHAQGLMRLLYRQRALAAARGLGEQMRQQPIGDAGLFANLGDIALQHEDFVEALRMYEQALAVGADRATLQARIDRAKLGARTGSGATSR